MQGIGENPSVTDVDVSDNDIVDIGPLSTATNLQRLNVANNNAKGPFTLQASNLIWVNAANNDFTSVCRCLFFFFFFFFPLLISGKTDPPLSS